MAELTRAREEKLAALEEIRALEADLRAGAVAEGDYVELHRQCEERAMTLIARVDALEAALGPAAGEASPPAAPGGERPPAAAFGAAPQPAPASRGLMRGPVLAATAALLLAAGLGLGYLVAVQSRPGPTAGAPMAGSSAGNDQAAAAAMAGPVMAQVREYRARLEKNPRDLEALLGMGELNLQRQDVKQAIEYYKRALDVDPGHPEALTRFGLILGQAGHFPEAIHAFDKALARNSGHVEALWLKGEVQLYGLRDFTAATTTWQRVVALLPEGPDRARAVAVLAEARAGGKGAPPGTPAPGTPAPKTPAPAAPR
jgi:tetratricopeptide (TPR) repeat protein